MLEVRGEGRPEAGAQPSCRAEIHGKNLIQFVCLCGMHVFFFFFFSEGLFLTWTGVR